MSDFELQQGIRYKLRNGDIIEGVVPREFEDAELVHPYYWVHRGTGLKYTNNGRIQRGYETPFDIIAALDHFVATPEIDPNKDEPTLEELIEDAHNRERTFGITVGEFRDKLEGQVKDALTDIVDRHLGIAPTVARMPPQIAIQLVQADGVTFEANVPLSMIANVGVITYFGTLFVYQHSTVFRSKPRFVEVQNAILNSFIFTQVSE